MRIGRLAAADGPFLLLNAQRTPGGHVMRVFLHRKVGTGGAVGTSSNSTQSSAARTIGLAIPSTRPSNSRWSRYVNPCAPSRTITVPPRRRSSCQASSWHTPKRIRAQVAQQIAICGGRTMKGALNGLKPPAVRSGSTPCPAVATGAHRYRGRQRGSPWSIGS